MNPDDSKLMFIAFGDEMKTASKYGGTHLILVDYYWSVHPERGLVVYRSGRRSLAPQCNQNERIALMLTEKLYGDWAQTRLVPMVFIPHDCKDYF